MQRDAGIDPGSPFADAALAIYQNSSSVAFVYVLEPGDDAAGLKTVEDKLGHVAIAAMPGATSSHEVTGAPPPAGCTRAPRWVASAPLSGVTLPVGATFCVAGDDLDVFAVAVGRIGDHQGYLAADDIVREVLRRRTAATPVATPGT